MDSPAWFVARHNQRLGPFTWEHLLQMARAGMIDQQDMILAGGSSKWLPAREVSGLFPEVALPHDMYWLSRDGKMEGPYSWAQLKMWVESGELVGHTLVCREDSDQWKPVAEIVGYLSNRIQPHTVGDPPLASLRTEPSRATPLSQSDSPELAPSTTTRCPTATTADLLLKLAALAAIPMWLFGADFGRLPVVLAGFMFLAWGVRVLYSGVRVSFKKEMIGDPFSNRWRGGVATLLGLVLCLRGGTLWIQESAARAEYDRGLEFLKTGDNDQAISSITAYIKADPKSAKAFYNRGLAYEKKGNLGLAIDDYSEALRIDPSLKETYIRRAGLYGKTGKLDLVIADCTAAIRLDSQYAISYFIRGSAYNEKGMTKEAEADVLRAIQLDARIEKLLKKE